MGGIGGCHSPARLGDCTDAMGAVTSGELAEATSGLCCGVTAARAGLIWGGPAALVTPADCSGVSASWEADIWGALALLVL